MKLRMNIFKLRDNAFDIVVVSDVNLDVMSPVNHTKNILIHTKIGHI